MTEPAEPGAERESAAPPETRVARRALAIGVWIVLGLLLLLAVMRVFIATIPPGQDAPDPHFGKPCVVCHFVIDDAEEIEVE